MSEKKLPFKPTVTHVKKRVHAHRKLYYVRLSVSDMILPAKLFMCPVVVKAMLVTSSDFIQHPWECPSHWSRLSLKPSVDHAIK